MCFLRLPKTGLCMYNLYTKRNTESKRQKTCVGFPLITLSHISSLSLPSPPLYICQFFPLFLSGLQITHIWRFEPRSLENSFCFVNISKFHADVESQTLCVCNKVSVQVFQCQARHLEGAARYAKYARESQAKCSKGGV